MNKHKIITLCGDKRFKDDILAARDNLTARGNIVFSAYFGLNSETAIEIQKEKIQMSDGIFVVNTDFEIGDEVKSDIVYAVTHGKGVEYKEKDENKICPVCEKYYFGEKNGFEICPVCGWEDDKIQRRDPDFRGGANKKSLKQAKREYHGLEADEI